MGVSWFNLWFWLLESTFDWFSSLFIHPWENGPKWFPKFGQFLSAFYHAYLLPIQLVEQSRLPTCYYKTFLCITTMNFPHFRNPLSVYPFTNLFSSLWIKTSQIYCKAQIRTFSLSPARSSWSSLYKRFYTTKGFLPSWFRTSSLPSTRNSLIRLARIR